MIWEGPAGGGGRIQGGAPCSLSRRGREGSGFINFTYFAVAISPAGQLLFSSIQFEDFQTEQKLVQSARSMQIILNSNLEIQF